MGGETTVVLAISQQLRLSMAPVLLKEQTIASGTKLRKDIDLVFASGDSISGIAFGAYAWGGETHATFGSEGIIKRGSTSGSYSFITDNSSNWNTYGWGDHSHVY